MTGQQVAALLAPFAIGALVLFVGSCAAVLAKHNFVLQLNEDVKDVPKGRLKRSPVSRYSENLAPYSDWIADCVSSATTFVAPVAGFTLAAIQVGPVVAAVVNVVASALSFGLFVYVITRESATNWSEKYVGWFSPVAIFGIAANILLALLTLGVFYYFPLN